MDIGLRIKLIRQNNNLSQEDFATSLGIKRTNLSHIESGKQLPTIKTLSEIVRIYDISYDYLIDGVSEKKEGPAYRKYVSNNCQYCKEKERTIKVLEDNSMLQKKSIKLLEDKVELLTFRLQQPKPIAQYPTIAAEPKPELEKLKK